MNMKGINISCASQAATAICLTMDQPSSPFSSPSLSSTILLGSASPAIDRYNPIIRDSRRTSKLPIPPSQPTLIPKPHKKKTIQRNPPKEKSVDESKKLQDDGNEIIKVSNVGRKSWSCTKPGEFISPPGSTRYLLSEKVFFNALSDFHDPGLKLFPGETSMSKAVNTDGTKPPSSSASSEQVVVLRVSLHCRGCERKMRKHISRMEGVKSYNIDFAAKKVTVTGNITPLEVLSSISKVKNAQIWSPTINLINSSSEFKNDHHKLGAAGA